MKLVSYKTEDNEHLGLFINGHIYNLNSCDKLIPDNMKDFLLGGEVLLERAKVVNSTIQSGLVQAKREVFYELQSPVPHPSSCREGYAFKQHFKTVSKSRGAEMPPEFDKHPVFYFTNHHAVQGSGDIELMPDHFEKLDFGLQAAVVIGKSGRNIKASEADQYIAGFMIMNDLSARTLYAEETQLNLCPAKDNGFCTVIGPWLVTADELDKYKVSAKDGHTGNSFNLQMKCWVNGKEVSLGSLADMHWTFAEIIERASYGVDLVPGDVISSGTVGTGCFLDLNSTGKLTNPDYKDQWLQSGDIVEMEITGLGRLGNTILKENTDWSIITDSSWTMADS